MSHGIGNAVRVRDGSDLPELLVPRDVATGRAAAALGDDARACLDVRCAEGGVTAFGVPAGGMAPDRPLGAAPL